MIGYIVVGFVTLLVGWCFPQPAWAKKITDWVKGETEIAVSDIEAKVKSPSGSTSTKPPVPPAA